MEHSLKNVKIIVYILWIDFSKRSPFHVLWEKKYAGLKQARKLQATLPSP